jgi:3-hydroxyacyl-[acyl-carrier-protein] dehydratase
MLDRDAILGSIPQGEPFVFVDEAEIGKGSIRGSYTITGEECFMEGHFPGRPVFPASIMVEALGQLAIVYLSSEFGDRGLDLESIYFLKSEDVHCRRKCYPGDRLDMDIDVRLAREPVVTFKGSISVGGELAVKVSSLMLSFALKPENSGSKE